MAEKYDHLTEQHQRFIDAQKIFFVGTAAAEGNINVSPKGLESLKIVNKNKVLWVNLTGSGNETAAHTQENPRMTLMFTSFEKNPLILRVYGTARAIHRLDPEWETVINHFPKSPGSRQVFDFSVSLVQTSCGYAVPYYDFKGERSTLEKWNDAAGEDGIKKYWEEKNTQSLDGIETGIVKKNIRKQ